MQNASVLVHSITVLKPPQNTMPKINAMLRPLANKAHARRDRARIHLVGFMAYARSVQARDALESVVHQRLGVALRHMALLAEVARRAHRSQLAAQCVAEVSHRNFRRLGGLGARPA